jgi:uncharacterized protein YuzE
MKFGYYPDTDTLNITIEHASEKMDLTNLSFAALPFHRSQTA